MKSNEEVDLIINDAEQELADLCKKHSVTLNTLNGMIFMDYDQTHKSGDYSIYGREILPEKRGYPEPAE